VFTISRWYAALIRTLEELLLQLSLGDLDLDRLVDLLLVPALVVGIVLDGGGEERVDEGGLAQPGLASNLANGQNRLRHHYRHGNPDHDRERSTPLGDNLVPLVGQIGNANRRRALGGGRSHLELSTDRNEVKGMRVSKIYCQKEQRAQLGRDVAEVRGR
jgi:hypothetical protein